MPQCKIAPSRLCEVIAADGEVRHPRASAHLIELCAEAEPFLDIHINSGFALGVADTRDLLAHGKRFVNVPLVIQPAFDYGGGSMQMSFGKFASPHHGFAAFCMYSEFVSIIAGSWSFPCLESCRSDEGTCSMSWSFTCFTGVHPRMYLELAALHVEPKAVRMSHFGTLRLLEWMPGKPGMSGYCPSDDAIAVLLELPSCAANNPSEATIAEHRAHAPAFVYSPDPFGNRGGGGADAS